MKKIGIFFFSCFIGFSTSCFASSSASIDFGREDMDFHRFLPKSLSDLIAKTTINKSILECFESFGGFIDAQYGYFIKGHPKKGGSHIVVRKLVHANDGRYNPIDGVLVYGETDGVAEYASNHKAQDANEAYRAVPTLAYAGAELPNKIQLLKKQIMALKAAKEGHPAPTYDSPLLMALEANHEFHIRRLDDADRKYSNCLNVGGITDPIKLKNFCQDKEKDFIDAYELATTLEEEGCVGENPVLSTKFKKRYDQLKASAHVRPKSTTVFVQPNDIFVNTDQSDDDLGDDTDSGDASQKLAPASSGR